MKYSNCKGVNDKLIIKTYQNVQENTFEYYQSNQRKEFLLEDTMKRY